MTKSSHETVRSVLELIKLLLPPGSTMQKLIKEIQKDRSTIYRYFDLIESVGFDVERKNKKHFIAVFDDNNVNQKTTLKLSQYEANELIHVILSYPEENPFTSSILKQLNQLTSVALDKDKVNRNIAKWIHEINYAIENRRTVLIEYMSASTGQKEERIIHPIRLTNCYKYIINYEPERDLFTNLNMLRVLSAKAQSGKNYYANKTDKGIDVFNMAFNTEEHHIRLALEPLAYRLLIEEYPRTKSCVKFNPDNKNFPYIFTARVAHFLPVARFVMGLSGFVRILETEALKAHIRERLTHLQV